MGTCSVNAITLNEVQVDLIWILISYLCSTKMWWVFCFLFFFLSSEDHSNRRTDAGVPLKNSLQVELQKTKLERVLQDSTVLMVDAQQTLCGT